MSIAEDPPFVAVFKLIALIWGGGGLLLFAINSMCDAGWKSIENNHRMQAEKAQREAPIRSKSEQARDYALQKAAEAGAAIMAGDARRAESDIESANEAARESGDAELYRKTNKLQEDFYHQYNGSDSGY